MGVGVTVVPFRASTYVRDVVGPLLSSFGVSQWIKAYAKCISRCTLVNVALFVSAPFG